MTTRVNSSLYLPRFRCLLSQGWEEPIPCPELAKYGICVYIDKAKHLRIFKAGIAGVMLEQIGKKSYRVLHTAENALFRKDKPLQALLACVSLEFNI